MSRAFSHTIKQVLLIGAILIAAAGHSVPHEEIVLIVMGKNTRNGKRTGLFSMKTSGSGRSVRSFFIFTEEKKCTKEKRKSYTKTDEPLLREKGKYKRSFRKFTKAYWEGPNMKTRSVGIVGVGHVGAHCAYSLAVQGIVDELVLVDDEGTEGHQRVSGSAGQRVLSAPSGRGQRRHL